MSVGIDIHMDDTETVEFGVLSLKSESGHFITLQQNLGQRRLIYYIHSAQQAGFLIKAMKESVRRLVSAQKKLVAKGVPGWNQA